MFDASSDLLLACMVSPETASSPELEIPDLDLPELDLPELDLPADPSSVSSTSTSPEFAPITSVPPEVATGVQINEFSYPDTAVPAAGPAPHVSMPETFFPVAACAPDPSQMWPGCSADTGANNTGINTGVNTSPLPAWSTNAAPVTPILSIPRVVKKTDRKALQRRARNTESVRRSRQRAKDRITELEKMVEQLQHENATLKSG